MHERTRRILEDLEAVRENLLALSDDIWLSIDHNDPKGLEEGVEFKRVYNEKTAHFDRLASEISAMVQQFTSVRLESGERAGGENQDQNVRLIRELDREQLHAIDEGFTYRRPHGFVLDGQAVTGITTWLRLFELVCRQLFERDVARFRALVENPSFISNRGHHGFTHDEHSLRKALRIDEGLFAECNLSANDLCAVIGDLLTEFNIPKENLRIYLREDRDAGRHEGLPAG
jgi:hypothetical protein